VFLTITLEKRKYPMLLAVIGSIEKASRGVKTFP